MSYEPEVCGTEPEGHTLLLVENSSINNYFLLPLDVLSVCLHPNVPAGCRVTPHTSAFKPTDFLFCHTKKTRTV